MTTTRHELTEDWAEVTGLTDGTKYRAWTVESYRPAFIRTAATTPAATDGGQALRPREHLPVTPTAAGKVYARGVAGALLLDDQLAS